MGRRRPDLTYVREKDLDPPVSGRPTRFFTEEVMRGLLALLFAFFLLIVIIWGFHNAGAVPQTWQQTKELLDALIPAVTALLGSAVGFYFGTQKPS